MSQEDIKFATLCVASILVFLLLVSVIIVFLFQIQRKNQKYLLQQEQLKSEFARTLLEAKLEMQEQTLQHVSRELHDNLGQVASLIKINLNTLHPEDRSLADAKLEDTRQLVRQLILDIKALSVSLGADRISRAGLWFALKEEMERIANTGLFTVVCTIPPGLAQPDPNTELILYRMAQEILNNALKHSKAKNIILNAESNGHDIILAFRDDGVGFPTGAGQSSGAGLNNLQHRAGLIGAKLELESAAGKGTCTTIRISI